MHVPTAAALRSIRALPLSAAAWLLVTLLTACAPVTRRGLEPIVTDRPDFTESAETVPKGMKQLEAGSTFTDQEGEENASVGEVLLRVGMTRLSELRVGLNSYSRARAPGVPPQRGFEDVSIGAKFKLLQSGGTGSLKPDIAVILASSLPTGTPVMTSGKPQPEVKFGLGWDLTERVAFTSNLNYARASYDAGDYDEYAATGSLAIGLTDRVGSYLEYFTFQPNGAPIAASHYMNGGFTYGFTDNLQLDVRSGIGLHRVIRRDFFLGLGISRRW